METEMCADEKGEAVRMKCFTGVGWRKFLNDLELGLCEFLVFSFSGECTFEVTVLGTNCCERVADPDFKGKSLVSLKFPARRGRGSDDDEEEDDHSHYLPVVVYRRSPLYFEEVLKPHHRYSFSLRKKFYVAAGLKGAETVELEYAGRWRRHEIELDRRYSSRVVMAGGWHDFRTENELVFAKKYSFEFKPEENFIHVEGVLQAGLKGKAEVGYGMTPSTVEVVKLEQGQYSTELAGGWPDGGSKNLLLPVLAQVAY